LVIYDAVTSSHGTATVSESHKFPILTLDPLNISGDAPLAGTFNGTLRDPDSSEGLPDRIIEFYIDDVKVKETLTLSDGSFSIGHTFNSAGAFDYYAAFPGDSGTG